MPIRVARECIWIGEATCWPSTAGRAARKLAIEAGHAVREIPTWMGLTAKCRVKCISLTEAKDILAGCKRLEQENRRREHQYFQE